MAFSATPSYSMDGFYLSSLGPDIGPRDVAGRFFDSMLAEQETFMKQVCTAALIACLSFFTLACRQAQPPTDRQLTQRLPTDQQLGITLQAWADLEKADFGSLRFVSIGPAAPQKADDRDTLMLPFTVAKEGEKTVGEGTATFRKSKQDSKWHISRVEQGGLRMDILGVSDKLIVH